MNDILKQMAKLPPEKRRLFKAMLQEKGIDVSQLGIAPQGRETNKFPLSFGQQRLWLLDQLEPGSPLYNNPAAVILTGPLDISALEKSLNEIIRRHEVMRTTFASEGDQPVQLINAEMPLNIETQDLRDLPEAERENEAMRIGVQEAQTVFDLSTGPLLRTKLLQLDKQIHWVLLTMNHAVSDAWSLGILVREVAALYEAFHHDRPAALPELPIQYADFSAWQREWQQDLILNEQLPYWTEQLQNCPAALNLQTDYPRPAYQSFKGKIKYFDLPDSLAKALNDLSKKEDVTLFMIFMAALQTLLFRYSSQEDICVGTPIAGRNRAETEGLIGFFVNTLIMRTDLSGNPTFRELLKRVREMSIGAFGHQDMPFETLVEKLQPERDMSRSPFFQVMFVHQNAPIQPLKLPDMTFKFQPIDSGTAKFDLTLVIEELEDGLSGHFVYNTDLFKSSTISRMIAHLQNILESVAANVNERIANITLLSQLEKTQLLNEWCDVTPYIPPVKQQLLHQLFEEQAAKTPDAVALVLNQEKLSFGELNQRANQLAWYLKKNGVQPESLVGISMERSLEMVVALLGIMKAGGAFLPLDPEYPKDRLNYMIEDSQIALLLTQARVKTVLPEGQVAVILIDADWEKISQESVENPTVISSDDNVAYVIYTSGSTGKPKGVQIPIGVFTNHCLNMCRHYQYDANDRVLEFASINFDAALEQLFVPLLAGARVVLRGPEVWSPAEFQKNILDYGLTVINPPTAYWQQLVQEWSQAEGALGKLRMVIVGGDAMRLDSLKRWKEIAAPSIQLLNAYGPTETTITATMFEIFTQITKNGGISTGIPIGKPLAHRSIYVLDNLGQLTPVGVPGELHIGGICLARGYLDRPGLTAEKFIPDSFSKVPGARLYCTGDLVRFLPDGNIEFLGRVDHQVKVRGFRIELGEIETALRQHAVINETVVVVREDTPGEKRLVAYWAMESAPEEAPASQEFRQFLSDKLPDYMIPSAFMRLDSIPRTPIGKVNRQALPKPELDRDELETEYAAPRNAVEEMLAELWANTLKVEKVGIHDNFFNLGGHSLMATQIISRIREQFQVELPLRRLFETPTISTLAVAIAQTQADLVEDDEVEDMLAELDGLSDEEVEKLLSEEM